MVKIYQGLSALFSIRWRAEKWCWHGQVNVKRRNGNKTDFCVRNASPNPRGLGREQMKQSWSRCDQRVWQLPALAGNATTLGVALHCGKQCLQTANWQLRHCALTLLWRDSPKGEEGHASSTSREREMKSVPSTSASKNKQFHRKLRRIGQKGVVMQSKLEVGAWPQWCCCLPGEGGGEFWVPPHTDVELQMWRAVTNPPAQTPVVQGLLLCFNPV